MPELDPEPRKPKTTTLSSRQRLLLHRLLHRELRKCSTGALEAFHRFGWILGSGGGYQLTEKGRRVAEFSESSAKEGELVLDLP